MRIKIAAMVKKYLDEIFQKYKTGDASERTYYSTFENLLKEISEKLGDYSILIEGKNSSVGIPDFKIKDSRDLLIGYIEAKDLGRDLDKLDQKEQEQIKKYVKEYDKLIVTNFIEFRLYEDHGLVTSVLITQPVTLKIGKPALDNEAQFNALIERFLYAPIQQIHTSKRLSELLAGKTRSLRNLISEEINLEDNLQTSTEDLLQTFQKMLDPEMKPEEFADMYAQTITFGLFVARIHSKEEDFNRFSAYKFIPNTISLLKEVFKILSWQDLPSHIEWKVDEIAETLHFTDIDRVAQEFFSHGKGRDPIIHFYETFLSEYDSSQREQLGVYYTPQPVVSYITRSLNKILKNNFDKKEGFADRSVITLDPAAGTLTFPAEAIAIAKKEFEQANGSGGWSRLVKDHILKNFYAFEILMAPYAVGHLKISLLLKELGYQMEPDERFELYLTNTLDMSKFQPQQTVLAEEISQESAKAYEIKDKIPVLVVMGNPPYSGHSSNKGEWIERQIAEYKKVGGKPLGEKNPKWLNDDYVKFIRFSQWKIEKTGQGVLGFITNHAWLDNPTFRGMRDSLMESFDEIYILNLHGSTLKKEKVPEEIQKNEDIGERDEGVFGIRPGTSILVAIKSNKTKDKCKVYYAEQWGSRNKKYEWLDSNDIESTNWENINPLGPSYFFVKKDEEGWDKYRDFAGINEIFPVNSVGVVTSRDEFVIDTDKHNLENRIRIFINSNDSDDFIKSSFGLKENSTWRVSNARLALRKELNWEKYIQKISYRPFDERWIFYHPAVIERPREEVMKHMLQFNLGLCIGRAGSVTGSDIWDVVYAASNPTDFNLYRRGGNVVFPLYTYNDESQQNLFSGDNHKNQNIDWNILPGWMATIQPFTSPVTNNFVQVPEAILYYIYAILYSNIYREKYQEFLKSDFPRIPFTNDYKVFQLLAILGEQLIELHLLKSKALDNPISHYEDHGDDIVQKRDYREDSNRLYINESQFFDKVTLEVWSYYIGGYQVLDRWFKERGGQVLSLNDQLHLRKVITALSKTIEIQREIDELYPEIEKSLVR